MFHSVVDHGRATLHVLKLVGVVCYYGKHYSTFFYSSVKQLWISFDDATVKEVSGEEIETECL